MKKVERKCRRKEKSNKGGEDVKKSQKERGGSK